MSKNDFLGRLNTYIGGDISSRKRHGRALPTYTRAPRDQNSTEKKNHAWDFYMGHQCLQKCFFWLPGPVYFESYY